MKRRNGETNLYLHFFQPLSSRASRTIPLWPSASFSFIPARFNVNVRETHARRYLSDFSKREANLNCRSRAIPNVVHFPWNALPLLLSLPLFFPSTGFLLPRDSSYLGLASRENVFSVLPSSENTARQTLTSNYLRKGLARSAKLPDTEMKDATREHRKIGILFTHADP